MFCNNCGKEIDDKAVICVNCGASVTPVAYQYQQGQATGGQGQTLREDKPMVILDIVSFLVPLVGLILYLTMMKETPICAKAYGKWALIGFIVGIVLTVTAIIVGCVAIGSMNLSPEDFFDGIFDGYNGDYGDYGDIY